RRQKGATECMHRRGPGDDLLAFYRTGDARGRGTGRDREAVRGEQLAKGGLIGSGIAEPLRDEDEGNGRRERRRAGNRAHRPRQPALDVGLGHLRAGAEERGVLLDGRAHLLGRGRSELAGEERDGVAEGEIFLPALSRRVPERHLDGARAALERARGVLQRRDLEADGVYSPWQ